MIDFHGAKLALLFEGKLLVYRRDQRNDIPIPGRWDFPGGGREGTESPEQCVLRELQEEFSISLSQDGLVYRRDYSVSYRDSLSCFFAAHADPLDIENIAFGDEGQFWLLMGIDEYLANAEGIPNLKDRLRDYLASSD
jgi:8-oxo-dGTP diphosphatase